MTATATPNAVVAAATGSNALLRRLRPVHVVAAETVLAAALMSYRLGGPSLWFDETVTAGSLQRSIPAALRHAVLSEPITGFYLFTMRLWSEAFGDHEVALRSLSVICCVALVPVTYALTARLFTTRTALVAGLLVAVSTTVVAQGQQARHYALVLLLVTLATLCFVRAVEVGSQQSWLLYAVVAALAVYSHALVTLVVVAHALSLLALARSEVPWRSVLFAAATFIVAVIPFFVLILRRGGSGLNWIPPVTWARARDTLEMLAGGNGYLLVAALVACGFAFREAVRSGAPRGRGIDLWRYTLLFAWLVVPVIGTVLVSFARPLFVSRYMIGALPALVILTAVGITAMRPSWLAAGFLVALVVLNGVVVVDWLGSDTVTARTGVPREDWRGAVGYVLAHGVARDAVVMQPRYLETSWKYYFRRDGSPHDAPALPLALVPYENFADRQQVRSISAKYRRVWLVISYAGSDRRRDVLATFGARYDHAATHRFVGGVQVLRYDARE